MTHIEQVCKVKILLVNQNLNLCILNTDIKIENYLRLAHNKA